MAVKFISHVNENEQGEWYIELTDTLAEQTVVCKNFDIYKEKIEELGAQYGNDIEVVWTKDKTLSLNNYQDISDKMAKLKEEYQNEIDQMNLKNQEDNGFNPNV